MNDVLARIKHTIVSDIQQLLADKKENVQPLEQLNDYLRQAEAETEKVHRLIERQYLLQKEFGRELQDAEEMAGKRQHQAGIAEKAGETELQYFAEEESRLYQTRTEKIRSMLSQTEQQIQSLESKYRHMNHKLKDMKLRRLSLMGNENADTAGRRMEHVLNQAENPQKQGLFRELEEKLLKEETANENRETIDSRIQRLEKDMQLKEN